MSNFDYEKERHLYNLLRSESIFKKWKKEQFVCQQNKCAWCEKSLPKYVEVDHIYPIFHGGKSTSDNLVLTCHNCNKEKCISTSFVRPSWIVKNKYSDLLDDTYGKIAKVNKNTDVLFDLAMYSYDIHNELLNNLDRLVIAKDKDCTSDISSMRLVTGDKCQLAFKSGKEYAYNSRNVKLEPIVKIIDTQCVVETDGTIDGGIEEILQTENYGKIIYNSGYSKTIANGDMKIIGSCLEDPGNRAKFNYIKEVVDNVTDLGLKDDNDEKILKRYFDSIDFIREDVILNDYLKGRVQNNEKNFLANNIIYPFGFNESQKYATENALNNKISIIQGPPGTGKTNTILNIISNIVINGKTVAVVSNNNSATDNIYEKLSDKDLNFVAARLGKKDNKKDFIKSQLSIDQQKMHDWACKDCRIDELYEDIFKLDGEISKGYKHKKNIAVCSSELEELLIEKKHFMAVMNKNGFKIKGDIFVKRISSEKLLKLWHSLEKLSLDNKKIGFLRRVLFRVFYKIKNDFLKKNGLLDIIHSVQLNYFNLKVRELRTSIEASKSYLHMNNIAQKEKQYVKISDNILKDSIGKKYIDQERLFYQEEDLWRNSKRFVQDYPIVLSTTYSLRKSLNKNFVYDYLIIDEASQVDLATFVLAISCAKNLVLVGDEKQLPNVVTSKTMQEDEEIFAKYEIPHEYRYAENSALSSVSKIFKNEVPSQLLREHYRCDPRIIGFCNKRFYDDQLIILTNKDPNNENPLGVYYTVPGNHDRQHMNQRQIDTTLSELVPNEKLNLYDGSVGIITPYRNHAAKMQEELKKINADSTKAATVDSFQGRERDVIIINTVDNKISDFASNPNRLNVAVSRAKKRLYVVVNGNQNSEDTGIDELIKYIKYNKGIQEHSKIHSIFDNLYTAYYSYNFKHHISDFPSEDLTCDMLAEILEDYEDLDFEFQYPLSSLCDLSGLSGRKLQYAMNNLTKMDFVIFRKASKTPILAIEVDGWEYHQKPEQMERDKIKDELLEKSALPLLRLGTNESNEVERVKNKLDSLVLS